MAEDKKGFSDEEKLELKTAYAEIEKGLGTKVADQTKAAVDAVMEPLNKEIKGLKDWKVEQEKKGEEDKKKDEANQKALDELISKGSKVEVKVSGANSFSNELGRSLEEKKDMLLHYRKNRTPISFELKAVGDVGSGNFSISGTEQFVNSQMFFEPGRKPYELVHVRDIPGIRVGPIGPAQDVYVIRDSGGEGGPTSVAAGAAKPQSDRDWVKTKVPITKIAHYYKIPEEYLEDITWLRDEITGVGVEELMAKEDSMFLTNSAGSEFLGLNQSFNSTTALPPAALLNLIVDASNYDVLVAGRAQLQLLYNNTTAVVLNPVDYALMILTKDTTGNYIFGAPNQAVPNLFGAPIIASTFITSDKYLMGDFTKVKIGMRAAMTVRFYDQNEDDAIKNMVTVVIEERSTIAADRADRLIYGDLSTQRGQLDPDVTS